MRFVVKLNGEQKINLKHCGIAGEVSANHGMRADLAINFVCRKGHKIYEFGEEDP